MRQYAWYSPELDVIVLQTIVEGCEIAFEWDWIDACQMMMKYGSDVDPMDFGLLVSLGEL